ncbi:MAG: DUF6599 family protein [Candidatus Omnitrophota bacterium]
MKVIRLIRFLFLLVVVFPFVVSAAIPASGEKNLFPDSGFVNGWQKNGDVKTFPGNGLYGHIDGGAELFLEYGFQLLRVQQYRNGTEEISVEVYRMNNPEAALGIYLIKSGPEKPVPGVTSRNTGDPYQIAILKGDCFVTVNNFNGTASLQPVMVALANKTLENIFDAKAEDLFALLPRENRVAGSELIIRGMYSLQSVYTLGEGDILSLKDKIFGVSAQYKGKNNTTYSRIMVRYPDTEYAQKAFSYLKANFDSYIKVLETKDNKDNKDNEDNVLLFNDYKGKFGKVLLKGNTLEILFNLDSQLSD